MIVMILLTVTAGGQDAVQSCDLSSEPISSWTQMQVGCSCLHVTVSSHSCLNSVFCLHQQRCMFGDNRCDE